MTLVYGIIVVWEYWIAKKRSFELFYLSFKFELEH